MIACLGQRFIVSLRFETALVKLMYHKTEQAKIRFRAVNVFALYCTNKKKT